MSTGSSIKFDFRSSIPTPHGSSIKYDTRGTPIPAIFASVSSSIAFGQVIDTNVKQESLENTVSFGQTNSNNVILESISNAIAFDTTPDTNVKQSAPFSDILFDQIIVAGKESQVSVESDVAFDSNADSNVIQENLSNDILFGQTVQAVVEIPASVENNVAFDSVVDSNVEIASPASSIAFADIVNVEQIKSVQSSFGFLQQVLTNVIVVNVESSISFGQEVARQAIFNRSLESNLSFEDTMGPTTEDSASSSIAFSAQAFRAGDPFNNVLFTDAVIAVASKGASNDVLFGQSVNAIIDATRALSNNIAFGQAVVAWIERNCDLQEYTPFGVAPTVVLGIRSDVTLVCGVDSIILRNPNFENLESLDVDRAFNTSRGGTPQLFRDTQWPETTEHSISFEALTRAKAQELLDFFKNCLGLLVTYTDYENRVWTGIILNPESAIVDEGFCKYTAEIQFIGNPV